jgi:hypothetical protein
MFNIAAIVTLVGVFIALTDLMRHKTRSYGIATNAPVVLTVAPTLLATSAPPSE